jgi:hypothetical protein
MVRNAADEKQVRNAGRKAQDVEALKRARLRAVMELPEGRAFLWDLLEDCRVYESIWHPSAQIHYNAGVQDTGHRLMARMLEASEELFQQLEREARSRRKKFESDIDASHTARANEGD